MCSCSTNVIVINFVAVTLMSVDPTLITNLVAKEEEHVKEIADKFQKLVDKHKVVIVVNFATRT